MVIPWGDLIGMRNRIAHDYLGTDYNLLYQVGKSKVPELRKQILAILNKNRS
jgi:uncharacterized protein with HEPN domain